MIDVTVADTNIVDPTNEVFRELASCVVSNGGDILIIVDRHLRRFARERQSCSCDT